MSEMRKKSPVIGGLLSALFPGIGQIYNEEYGKGIILIAVTITTISSIVYSSLTILPRILSSLSSHSLSVQMIQPGTIATLVGATLVLFAVWLYGIIDAITGAQRVSTKTPENTAETYKKNREGTKPSESSWCSPLLPSSPIGVDFLPLWRSGHRGSLRRLLLLRGTGLIKRFPEPAAFDLPGNYETGGIVHEKSYLLKVFLLLSSLFSPAEPALAGEARAFQSL